MDELKVNKKAIKKNLDTWLNYDTKEALVCDTIAKCYMYLGNKESSKEYIFKAIENVKELICEFKNNKNRVQQYGSRLVNLANYNRIVGNYSEMKNTMTEVLLFYRSLYAGDIKQMPDTFRRFYFEFCSILFHLEKYEEAYEIGCFIRHGSVAPRGYAKGLLDNDMSIIASTMEEVIKDIKDEKIQPYYNPLNVEDPWEWYEIGRQLLGLPTVLDMFKEDS